MNSRLDYYTSIERNFFQESEEEIEVKKYGTAPGKNTKKKFFPLAIHERCVIVKAVDAPVAQLDRASGYGPEGCRFKSYQVHHSFSLLISLKINTL